MKKLIAIALIAFCSTAGADTIVTDVSGSTIKVCQVVCTEIGCRVICY